MSPSTQALPAPSFNKTARVAYQVSPMASVYAFKTSTDLLFLDLFTSLRVGLYKSDKLTSALTVLTPAENGVRGPARG